MTARNELHASLLRHRRRTTEHGDALVFGVSAVSAFEPSTVRRRAIKAWSDAGAVPIALHECRHTFAMMLAP